MKIFYVIRAHHVLQLVWNVMFFSKNPVKFSLISSDIGKHMGIRQLFYINWPIAIVCNLVWFYLSFYYKNPITLICTSIFYSKLHLCFYPYCFLWVWPHAFDNWWHTQTHIGFYHLLVTWRIDGHSKWQWRHFEKWR